MKILVIGSGGREHAVCKKFLDSKKVEKLFAFTSNAGICEIADCNTIIDVKNHDEVINFCKKNEIDLVFIGPEQPLVEGLADDLRKAEILTFGPSKFVAQLEGSKDFMKKIAVKKNIPTAQYQTFTEFQPALDFAKKLGFPCVVKADGLASGKGVVILENEDLAIQTITEFFAGKFGNASKKIIIEEFLSGIEVSHFAICDGKNFISLGFACDHKKVGENETGLNTGGMGTFSPSPFVDKKLEDEIIKKIVAPTLQELEESNNPFVGIIFSGVILTKDGPKLLEYNVRFGDPETQVILPRIKSDFVDLILAACKGNLDNYKIEFDEENKFVCVVVCAKGYPENYEKNREIKNLEEAEKKSKTKILHAGTISKNGKILSNGGRVLNIVAQAKTFKEARKKAYQAFDLIDYEDGFVRFDIAKKVENL